MTVLTNLANIDCAKKVLKYVLNGHIMRLVLVNFCIVIVFYTENCNLMNLHEVKNFIDMREHIQKHNLRLVGTYAFLARVGKVRSSTGAAGMEGMAFWT